MFSRSRRTEGPRDRRTEEDIESLDGMVRDPRRVKVVIRGLAPIIVIIAITFICQSQPSSPAVPVAFATCERFRGYVKTLARPADYRKHYACLVDGTLLTWNPRSSHARVAVSQGIHVVAATFTPDGSRLAVMDSEGVVSLWDLTTWRRWAVIPPRGGTAEALALSRDGSSLATADGPGVRLWDLTTARPSAGPQLDLPSVTSLAFAADGRTLAVATVDGAVRLWDSAQASQGARFRAHPYHVKSLAFSEDGRVLATSSPNDSIARLWEAKAGRLLKELDGRAKIQTMAFAPGGRELATSGFDGTVRLWDVATGDSRWVLSERDGPVSALDFSADGGTLACGGFETIRFYRLDVPSQAGPR
jgi:WD40 repeat protein